MQRQNSSWAGVSSLGTSFGATLLMYKSFFKMQWTPLRGKSNSADNMRTVLRRSGAKAWRTLSTLVLDPVVFFRPGRWSSCVESRPSSLNRLNQILTRVWDMHWSPKTCFICLQHPMGVAPVLHRNFRTVLCSTFLLVRSVGVGKHTTKKIHTLRTCRNMLSLKAPDWTATTNFAHLYSSDLRSQTQQNHDHTPLGS